MILQRRWNRRSGSNWLAQVAAAVSVAVGGPLLAQPAATPPAPAPAPVPAPTPTPAPTTAPAPAASAPAAAGLPLQIENSIGMRLKLIKPGTFAMGDAHGDANERPPHRVTFAQPVYMAATEVTNAQWKRLGGRPPSHWTEDNRPVEQVSWTDAADYCKRLSALPDEQAAGRFYRLPTEAEWEYACRGGTTTQYWFGDDETQLWQYGWFADNAAGRTHPVGQKPPNAWGLSDMHGNVWEWCGDWYGPYPAGEVQSPLGPEQGLFRVMRGGGWCYPAGRCRSAFRESAEPSFRGHYVGFRVVMTPAGPPPAAPAPPPAPSPGTP